ncbi:MAG: DUF3566 domain-containing protein [Rothia sp. (in: high G+C Gram-positive bacteria)]|uniref:DUF3566 domain-containing protein n=1 Tax=Rothia sp. (in: high G+C Gram-positive bacteria) TaxID=1885016 RepID=UPI0026DF2127|nr:DUF3566 domain-containing protein [Rothia sp. (in: high G+C Gram-positive bacteria)]MDO5749605.1 DUF3566 domain-containing protein [Rothia sp. (in: high G+C Gram-positive bacteria)]
MSTNPQSASSAQKSVSTEKKAAPKKSASGAKKAPAGAKKKPVARKGRTGPARRTTAARRGPASRAQGSRRQLVRPAPRSKIRRARLVVQKIDPWSVAKMVFLLSMALGIVVVVASVLLFLFLQASGSFQGINQLLTSLGTGNQAIDITQMVSVGQVALITTIISVVNTVLFTLLGMIAATLYNLAARLVGGITLTMSDE